MFTGSWSSFWLPRRSPSCSVDGWVSSSSFAMVRSAMIVVVSGLPRSGTSLMMQMLEAGGLPILTDNRRPADPDNPKGYYEFEPVKQLARDQAWIPSAVGKVVKVVSPLLRHLPSTYSYKIVFMQREIEEVLASQREMLQRRGGPAPDDDEVAAGAFRRHLVDVQGWLTQQPNMQVCYVAHDAVLARPAVEIQRVNDFLGGSLDTTTMAQVVDRSLHRHSSRRSH